MALRRIPGTDRTYQLIAYDAHGVESPDPDGSSASEAAIAAITDQAAGITDVFVLSHGWQGDYADAIRQYDTWLGAGDPDAEGDGVVPLVVGLHWPSKAWSDTEVASAPSGLLGGDAPAPADAVPVADAVAEYAAILGAKGVPEVEAALTTVLDQVAATDPGQDASAADSLPPDVAEAYRTIAGALKTTDAEEPLLGGAWDPTAAFDDAKAATTGDDGLLGGGFIGKLRDLLLTPLRQLTFWHSKNQARVFGESGAAQLVRAIMTEAPTVRVHLMGHSFGTVVLSGAVRGPGDAPAPPPRPVSSMYLVQGAVSLWAFADDVPHDVGGGRGYFADVLDPAFVSGTVVATTSRWDYAVGRAYPMAVGLVGQYLLGDLPTYGGLGAYGIQGVGATQLPPLQPGSTSADTVFTPGTVYNVDASAVIDRLSGAAGAHNDLGHPELQWLGWRAALAGVAPATPAASKAAAGPAPAPAPSADAPATAASAAPAGTPAPAEPAPTPTSAAPAGTPVSSDSAPTSV